MPADPLGDVGLRRHHALLGRAIPGELKILFFAIGRVGDGADGQDDLYHSRVSLVQGATLMLVPRIDRQVSNFGKILSSNAPVDCRLGRRERQWLPARAGLLRNAT